MNGKLNLVSVGPGFVNLIAPMAEEAIAESEIVVGYDLYLNWIKPWLNGKELITLPLTQERERAEAALTIARQKKCVSLVSSGDIGVYAMASLVFDQMLETDTFDLRVVPGITAANSCASILGAPLSHDFATLSLSDLLCPWSWIEHRARAIAQGDLAVALYNVQSKARQDGIYKILKIFLEHKHPQTLCGVVRSAYRSDQSTSISTLEELLDRSFDMFTTIIIGNKFTQRKRDWIFTPRGYNSWQVATAIPTEVLMEVPVEVPIEVSIEVSIEVPIEVPIEISTEGSAEVTTRISAKNVNGEATKNAIWIFSGTSDGNALANELAVRGYPVVVSAASDYGRRIAEESCPGVRVVAGRIGEQRRREELTASSASAVIDATHPFAEEISKQLMEICKVSNIPYLRFERAALRLEDIAEKSIVVSSMQEAIDQASSLGKRIFLATGTKNLGDLNQHSKWNERLWFTRVLPDPDSVQQALTAGIPAERICAIQGPFSQSFNEALWREWQIDCVVTKESGTAGGFMEKVNAAARLSIPVIVIKRPQLDFPLIANNVASIIRHLEDQETLCNQ